jgi:Immunity protein 26
MKLPYSEGSVFLVPLRRGGYARGVVARAGAKGKILLGYFFGPRIESIGTIALDDLNPAGAALRMQFGDLGLINGAWSIVGRIPNWNRAEWPMPEFVRRDPLSGKAWLVRRSDTNPGQIDSERPTDFDSPLPEDALSGYGAVEIKLTKIIG